MDSNVEQVGLGAGIPIPDDITTDAVWEILIDKISHPYRYLPVTDVITRPSDDGIGTYREMSLGPRRIIENIYHKPYEVKFCVTNDESEHVNVIHIEPNNRSVEFYLRNTKTLERMHWSAPKPMVLAAITKIYEAARLLQDSK